MRTHREESDNKKLAPSIIESPLIVSRKPKPNTRMLRRRRRWNPNVLTAIIVTGLFGLAGIAVLLTQTSPVGEIRSSSTGRTSKPNRSDSQPSVSTEPSFNRSVPRHLKTQVTDYVMANFVGIDQIEFTQWKMRKFNLKPQSEMSLDELEEQVGFQAFQVEKEWIGLDCVEVETEIGPAGLRRRQRHVFVTDGSKLLGGPFEARLIASESYSELGGQSVTTAKESAGRVNQMFNLTDNDQVEFNLPPPK